MGIYEKLGVRRVVNAYGNLTLLGGSIIPPEALRAMSEANKSFVDMQELHERAGKIVAEICGVEAAYVTSGAAAALVLASAVCMTGDDPAKMRQLPDTTGMKSEVIIQKSTRYSYDRCMEVAGAKFVEAGSPSRTTPGDVEKAITNKTASILYGISASRGKDVVPLEEVIRIAKKHGVPVIVDAAAEVYPPENFKKFVAMGADLVAFGGKYWGAPQASGILLGRRDLVQSAAKQGYIGFEYFQSRGLGRGMKVDRQSVVGLIVALQRWMKMDHDRALRAWDRRVRYLVKELNAIEGVSAEPAVWRDGKAYQARVKFEGKALKMTLAGVVKALKDGKPSVRVRVEDGGGAILVNTRTLLEGEERIVIRRVRETVRKS